MKEVPLCRADIKFKKTHFVYFLLFLTKVIQKCWQHVISPCVLRIPNSLCEWK